MEPRMHVFPHLFGLLISTCLSASASALATPRHWWVIMLCSHISPRIIQECSHPCYIGRGWRREWRAQHHLVAESGGSKVMAEGKGPRPFSLLGVLIRRIQVRNSSVKLRALARSLLPAHQHRSLTPRAHRNFKASKQWSWKERHPVKYPSQCGYAWR